MKHVAVAVRPGGLFDRVDHAVGDRHGRKTTLGEHSGSAAAVSQSRLHISVGAHRHVTFRTQDEQGFFYLCSKNWFTITTLLILINFLQQSLSGNDLNSQKIKVVMVVETIRFVHERIDTLSAEVRKRRRQLLGSFILVLWSVSGCTSSDSMFHSCIHWWSEGQTTGHLLLLKW